MLKLYSSRPLTFTEVVDLNQNYASFYKDIERNDGARGLVYLLLKKCPYCHDNLNVIYKCRFGSIGYTLACTVYLKPIFIRESELNNEEYKNKGVVDMFEDLIPYIIHPECIEKFKALPIDLHDSNR